MMNTCELNDHLRNIKNFVGTFPCNFIPLPTQLPAYYVVNLSRFDPNEGSRQGTHWVAVAIDEKQRGTYFDSLGMPPLQSDIQKFLNQTCKRFKHNTQTLQSPDSNVCGVYCIDFICAQSRGIGLREYMRIFRMNHTSNDQLVVKRVSSQMGHLNPRYPSNLNKLLN